MSPLKYFDDYKDLALSERMIAVYFLILNIAVSSYLAIYQHFEVALFLACVSVVLVLIKCKNHILKDMALLLKYIPIHLTLLDKQGKVVAKNFGDEKIIDLLTLGENKEQIIKVESSDIIKQYFTYQESIKAKDEILGFLQIQYNITELLDYIQKHSFKIQTLRDSTIQSSQMLGAVLDSNDDGILIFAYDSLKKQAQEILYFNQIVANWLSFLGDLSEVGIYDIFDKSQRERIESILTNTINYQPILFESMLCAKDKLILVEINAHLCTINNTNMLYLSIRDISVRKELELKRDRNRMLAIKDNKISLVVYLLSILFVKITNYTRPIKEQAQTINNIYVEAKEESEEIIKNTESIDDVIKDLISFYTPMSIKTYINIKTLLEKIQETLFFKEIINNTIITIIQKGEVKEIYGDEDAMKYVFIAVINNSLESIELNKGSNFYGKINITIENFDDNYILISIEDNAGGVSEEVIGRVFDMYYSTKIHFAGLGLSTCKVIVEDILQGSIAIANINEGTKTDIKIAKQ